MARRQNLIVAAGTAMLLAACVRPVTELELITPPVGVDRAVAEQIVALVEADSGVRIRLIPPLEDGRSELDALEAGYGDIAFAPNNEHYRDGISTIMPLYQSTLHVLVSRDKVGLQPGEQLTDARIYAGPPGSIARAIGEEIVRNARFTSANFTFVDHVDEDFDVLLMYLPIDREQVLAVPGVENYLMVSLGTPEEIGNGHGIDRAVMLNPRLRPVVLPAGTYDDLTPEPAVTLAVDNLLVARSDLDEAVVYDLFGEMLRIRPALFGDRPELFQPIGEDLIRANWTYALHPGSLAFLQQNEPSFVERYSGVAEVLVTLVVALVSGVFALLKIFSIRRKNRIDRFYMDVIRIRDSVAADGADTARRAAVEEIRKLQNHAYELLVHEKLAADESFRIFVELTNNAIDEINAAARR